MPTYSVICVLDDYESLWTTRSLRPSTAVLGRVPTGGHVANGGLVAPILSASLSIALVSRCDLPSGPEEVRGDQRRQGSHDVPSCHLSSVVRWSIVAILEQTAESNRPKTLRVETFTRRLSELTHPAKCFAYAYLLLLVRKTASDMDRMDYDGAIEFDSARC